MRNALVSAHMWLERVCHRLCDVIDIGQMIVMPHMFSEGSRGEQHGREEGGQEREESRRHPFKTRAN